MKKVLSFLLITIFLLSALSTVTFAAAPQTSDFVAGTGFFVYEGSTKKDRDIPTLTQITDGVQVSHGGWYASGADYGGIISAQKVDLNGFEITVKFNNIPTYSGDDCWIAFDFLAAQRGFYTDNFDVATGNKGMMNLIRYGNGGFQAMDGLTSFSGKKTVSNDLFKFKTGDVVTLTVNRTAVGDYTYTFKKEGVADPVVIDYDYPMDELFSDGKAYFSLAASSKKSVADDFVYTITNVKNGTAMTAADRAAIEAAKRGADAAATLAEANARITSANNTVQKAITRAQACGSDEALAKANKGAAKVAEAKTTVESGTFTLDNIKELCTEATNLAKAANNLSKEAENAATDTESETESQAVTEAQTQATDTADEGGFPGWAIALIVGGAVVIVAVVVILVVVRKKK
ncbi:MAG: hypothetical protein IJY47_05690 [Clostridia bacterium]|nr:hypothetical protein [Clostridia bacterium]